MEAELAALVAIRDRDQTRYDAIVARYATEPATEAAAPGATPSSDPGPLLDSLVEDFLAEERASGLVQATLQKERAVLAEFVDVAGNKAIRCYTKSDATQFKNALLKSPANRNAKPFTGLGLTDAVKLAEDMRKSGSEVPSLNVDTINDKLLYARKLFAWADGRFGDVSNPFEGQRIKRRRQRGRRSDRRYPFTTRELQALFDGPIYRGCKSRHHWKQPGDLVLRDSARFWAPLIALHTGMRLGEIIQLRMADIRTDADGIAYFDVTTHMDDDDEEAAKSLKNVNSVRQIPIHPQLIAFGLQHLIDQRRKASAPRLLMDYGRSEVDGKWSKTFGAWFRHYRRHVGVERFVNGKNRVDFHSFRHVFEDVVRDLPDVKQEVRDALQGHGENGVSQGYGTGVYRKRLYEAIQKVCFPDLDLSHLVIDGPTN